MKDLLPHYERELGFLREQAGEFARQNPKIAGRLLPGDDSAEDPHVQRLVESFALLSARIHKRLDDDFPLFTESLLEVLYPHYLRPFPACSIARFEAVGAAAATMTSAVVVPRGSRVDARPVQGVKCRFRTAYDVALAPVRLVEVAFRSGSVAPAGAWLPPGVGGALSVGFELASPQADWASLGVDRLRVFLDGEASLVATLRDLLCGRVVAVAVETGSAGWRIAGPEAAPRAVGFGADETLLDADPRSHPAYPLLTEYFAFAEKFDFVDLPLPAEVVASPARRVVLHYLVGTARAEADTTRLLEGAGVRNLLLGCTPVVNLMPRRAADPIRVTHASASYPVVVDARQAAAHEVHSIDRVYRVRRSAGAESIDEFKPFYSLRHDDLLAEGESAGRYWSTHRDDSLAEQSPGHELAISIVDIDADPALPATDTLSIEVTATNRDLPSRLAIGQPGGDLTLEDGSVACEIRLLRRPTPTVRFERGRGALWRLISHLSLNHLSLSAGGIEALRELLRLYDLPRSATNARQIAGLLAIDFRPASACLTGNPFPAFVRGTEIRLTVDEDHFAGSGLRLFADVLDRFFGLVVHANSFTQLKLVSGRTGAILASCPRRSGDGPLL